MSSYRSRLVPARAFLPDWAENDVTAFLSDLVREHREFRYGKFIYVFVEPEELEEQDDKLTLVTLAKIRREFFAQYFDREEWRLIDRALPGMRSEERSYLLIADDGLLIIEERRPALSWTLILRVVTGFAKDAFEGIGSLVIHPLGKTVDVVEAISQWEGISRISFRKLQISNPNARRVFERMEDVLRDANADESTIAFSSEEAALNISEDSLIRSGIELSNEGYGDYTIEGEREGESVSLSRRQALLKHVVEYGTRMEWADRAISILRRLMDRGG